MEPFILRGFGGFGIIDERRVAEPWYSVELDDLKSSRRCSVTRPIE
jgi:hypothetical protein